MARATGVSFLHAGRVASSSGWHLRAHKHAFCEIIVVVRGTHQLAIQGREHLSGTGEALFYRHGVPHEERSGADSPLEIVFAAFSWDEAPAEIPVRVTDAKGRIGEMIRWLIDETGSYDRGSPEVRDALAASLAAEFLRCASVRPSSTVDAVRAFIRANLGSPMRLEQLAGVSGLSRYHFIRSYRALTGRTPMAEVRQLRLEAARDLLLTTNIPLKQIAPTVGFESEYHLSRLFRRHFGLSARQLRQRVATRG